MTDHQQSKFEIFWGEIPPCEHFVQLYDDDRVFLDTLEGFVGGGLRIGDAVLVIATAAHIKALEDRLIASGLDLSAARSAEQYIPLDAEETLSKFMVNGWPDEDLFERVIRELLVRARKEERHVRGFGEMVAILWARGDSGATVRLEHLWKKLCQAEMFSLFCAYPRIGFTQDMSASIKEICEVHSKVFGA